MITRIDIIKDKLKLGTKKAGYEIGFTRFEPLPKKCWITGNAILEPDFKNKFNTADRNRMILLEVAHIPEVAMLLWWLYQSDTELITFSGDEVANTAVPQG